MIDIAELAGRAGDNLVLEFKDGHEVRARLVHVDTDEVPQIIYDVLEVVRVGPARYEKVRVGTVASADPRDLNRFRSA